MTAEPGGRSGPGPLIRVLGRAVNAAVARFPWSWRLFRGPVRRFSDAVAVGWDERVRSDSPEYLVPLRAALDRLPARSIRRCICGDKTRGRRMASCSPCVGFSPYQPRRIAPIRHGHARIVPGGPRNYARV